jgi:dihydrolipoamide dehydrogenase
MELGTVYATFGSKVVVVEALDTILAGADPDLARPVVAHAKKFSRKSASKPRSAKCPPAGKQIKSSSIEGRKTEELYDRVLVAVGRGPTRRPRP